ncbi:hypothetical protein [Methylobacterium sp. J-090]|uniref:hypothetical protein n=1 Tax=Methylobacterium sp. J-090 TaxID=2836666 RepID=UPI001FB9CE58|nr:hypothetical protein [Methylobacterium sp. J-090]MCJ2081723.1 hypothetical protein [Methylobacterium sp. J-090]
MMQINVGDHTSSQSASGWIAVPPKHREMMRWARSKAVWIAANKPAANVYFRSLKHGRSLSQIVADRNVWINFIVDASNYGWGETPGLEVAMSTRSFREGRWQLLASLCHELAHTNGADEDVPGGKQAEEAVLHCGMGYASEKSSGKDDTFSPYSPAISG